jgi:hypothetical protein
MQAKYVFESINFERGLDPRAALGIGNEKFRDQAKLKKFAADNGFGYDISKNGTPYVYFPVDYEEYLGYGKGHDWIKTMEYTITYPAGWDKEGKPISLRKKWINREGKFVKQALIDRFPNIESAIDRIKKQAIIEMAKKGASDKSARIKRMDWRR